MFKAASGRGFGIKGQGSKIFSKFVIRDMFRQTLEMKADKSDAPDIVLKGAAALPFQDNLLL